MNVPSFLFTSADSNVLMLNQELDQLGGGDACLAPLQLDVIVDDELNNRSGKQAIWPLGKKIGIRDCSLPRDKPVSECMRYFDVSSISKFSSMIQQRSMYSNKCR
jgi:hypothetical protein